MPDPILSPTNPRIKNILRLQAASRERHEQNLFVIEGFREISRAIISGIEIRELYVCRELDRQGRGGELLEQDKKMHVYDVGKAAFARIAYRE